MHRPVLIDQPNQDAHTHIHPQKVTFQSLGPMVPDSLHPPSIHPTILSFITKVDTIRLRSGSHMGDHFPATNTLFFGAMYKFTAVINN